MAKFYICKVCGNLIEKIDDSGVTPTCCNRIMSELQVASTDGAKEKHVPFIVTEQYYGGIMKVCIDIGSSPHPMEDLHYIRWVELITDEGCYRKSLSPWDDSSVFFFISDEETIQGAYAFCNLHGLWYKEVD